MLSDHFVMAFKNLKNRRLRAWLTIIGIFIGIMALVSLISLGEGLRIAISAQFGFLGDDILTVSATGGGQGPPGTGVTDPLQQEDTKKISDLKEIDKAGGRLIDYTKIRFDDNDYYSFAGSLPEGEGRDLVLDNLGVDIDEGRMLKEDETGKIMLGNTLAETLEDVRVGSRLFLEDKRFEVVGIFEKKGSFPIDRAAYTNEEEHEDLFGREEEYDNIIARYNKETFSLEESLKSTRRLMRDIRDVDKGEENFEVESSENAAESLNSTLFAVQLFVYIIAGISIIVGGIGIMTTMYTSVVERTREIGIMKSLGARNKRIFMIFFIESGFLGFVGGAVGVILGVLTAKGAAYLGSLYLGSDLIQAVISPWLIAGALAFSFILGSVFGTFPALRASKMHPVDALRYSK
ncbi:MAG: ABC transporter permease [Nanobdellota archaeon]